MHRPQGFEPVLREGLAFDKFHGEVGSSVFCSSEVEDFYDIWMVQLGEGEEFFFQMMCRVFGGV